MALTVYENVKEEMLIGGTKSFAASAGSVSLIDSTGTVVGVVQGTSNTKGTLGWDGSALVSGDLTQDTPIVFELEAGDNVAGFKLYNILSPFDLALTYQFETVYNYATAGTFTISGAKATIN